MASKPIRMKTTVRLDSNDRENHGSTVESDKSWSFRIYVP